MKIPSESKKTKPTRKVKFTYTVTEQVELVDLLDNIDCAHDVKTVTESELLEAIETWAAPGYSKNISDALIQEGIIGYLSTSQLDDMEFRITES